MVKIALVAAMAVACGSAAAAQATKTVNTIQTPARIAPAGTPTLQIYSSSAGQADLCIGEVSGAYGNTMLAVTLDWSRRDKVCALLRQAKFAADLQLADLSYQLMCSSPDWRAADAKTDKQCK